MMNVSDNTRLSNTIHRSSITKYVLLDAQRIWPAQCNNARLFTVVHYLCWVFECIYPTILSHNIQITTYIHYTHTYEPPERLPPESQIYSSIGGSPVHRWPRKGKMDIQCLKTERIAHESLMRESLMDIWSAITNGLIYRDGYTAVWLLSQSDYGLWTCYQTRIVNQSTLVSLMVVQIWNFLKLHFFKILIKTHWIYQMETCFVLSMY